MEVLDLSPWLVLTLGEFQVFALVFILGSLSVAALSDYRHRSAQSEFIHVWQLATVVVLAYDLVLAYISGSWLVPAVKWILILVLSLLSYKRFHAIFSLEWGDVAACAAVCGLLSPLLIIIFFVILKLLSLAMAPFLKMKWNDGAYPFIPVVFVAVFAHLALFVWVLPALLSYF